MSHFVEQVFNFPKLAEAYRVAALSIQGQRKVNAVKIETAAVLNG